MTEMIDRNSLRIKRIYDSPAEDDGFRVLIDRLWPRGVTRDRARIDLWAKQLAPTNELRTWFNHEPGKLDEFTVRYLEQLQTGKSSLSFLIDRIRDQRTTLLYAARDPVCNHAIVLRDFLLRQ